MPFLIITDLPVVPCLTLHSCPFVGENSFGSGLGSQQKQFGEGEDKRKYLTHFHFCYKSIQLLKFRHYKFQRFQS